MCSYNLVYYVLIGRFHLEDEVDHVLLAQVIGHVTVPLKGYRLVGEVCQGLQV